MGGAESSTTNNNNNSTNNNNNYRQQQQNNNQNQIIIPQQQQPPPVERDAALAQFMGTTGSTDFDLMTALLDGNAWCLELAIDEYNRHHGAAGVGGQQQQRRGRSPPVQPGIGQQNANRVAGGAGGVAAHVLLNAPQRQLMQRQQENHASADLGLPLDISIKNSSMFFVMSQKKR